MTGRKYVFAFGNGKAEGSAEMRNILGGKGANLAEMSNLGLPVPHGFTISAEVCDFYYKNNRQYPEGLRKEIRENLEKLEENMQARLGDPENPLLVSVRSVAAASMPGMMDTVLNLGLTPDSLQGLVRKTNNERFVWDAYRRFISMFSSVVMGIEREKFEALLDALKKKVKVKGDTGLATKHLQELVEKYKALYKKETGGDFPTDPETQLDMTINAVFQSWNTPRAIKYRQLYNITGLLGTAVNVQSMFFGNMGDHSATGVCFTRNPSTGKNLLYGEFLINAQGEDVVAGIRTPEPIEDLKGLMPHAYEGLLKYKDLLERRYRDMQDIEFTIQENKLYMLQRRNGKRTAEAALKIAVDLVREGLIDKNAALTRIDPHQLDQLMHPVFDPKAQKEVIATGLPASPGAATGKAVFSAEEAEHLAAKKEKVILVRKETSPEDIAGMYAAQGVLTTRGGMTSHAAVVARGMGKPCIVGACAIDVDYKTQRFSVNGKVVKRGDYISLDGSLGEVILGRVSTVEPSLSGDFATIMEWADEVRRLKVRANADTPEDARKAREFGAQGIGLCRTEHMFFGENRIDYVRQMILVAADAKNLKAKLLSLQDELEKASRDRQSAIKKEISKTKAELKHPQSLYTKALNALLPMQRGDFEKILTVMDGLPVTIRLLDPPLHEFLPQDAASQTLISKKMKVSLKDMQVRAIIEAACNVKKKGLDVYPEIMIPLVGTEEELKIFRDNIHALAGEIIKKKGVEIKYTVGTMIELPRAAVTADRIARQADFFSFGTNALTQMTFGFSRDDIGSFLSEYIERGILPKDPFQSLDLEGVGMLVEIGVKKGRSTKPALKIGICGEHGGDPASIAFCHRIGLDYVSCSPFRVPIARLAAAQANIKKTETASTV